MRICEDLAQAPHRIVGVSTDSLWSGRVPLASASNQPRARLCGVSMPRWMWCWNPPPPHQADCVFPSQSTQRFTGSRCQLTKCFLCLRYFLRLAFPRGRRVSRRPGRRSLQPRRDGGGWHGGPVRIALACPSGGIQARPPQVPECVRARMRAIDCAQPEMQTPRALCGAHSLESTLLWSTMQHSARCLPRSWVVGEHGG